MTLVGTNFPPKACLTAFACDARDLALSSKAAAVTIKFESSEVRSVGGAPGSSATFACASVSVLEAGTKLSCVVARGVGAALSWALSVGTAGVHSGGTTMIAAVSTSSGFTKFVGTAYAPPTILDLQVVASGSGSPLGAKNILRLSTAGGDKVRIVIVGVDLPFLLPPPHSSLSPSLSLSSSPPSPPSPFDLSLPLLTFSAARSASSG